MIGSAGGFNMALVVNSTNFRHDCKKSFWYTIIDVALEVGSICSWSNLSAVDQKSVWKRLNSILIIPVIVVDGKTKSSSDIVLPRHRVTKLRPSITRNFVTNFVTCLLSVILSMFTFGRAAVATSATLGECPP